MSDRAAQLKDALVKAHEAGDTEGARVIAEELKAAPAAPAAPAAETTGGWERFGTGMMDPIVGAAQLAEKTPVIGHGIRAVRGALGIDASMDDVVKDRDKDYKAPEGVDWTRMAGNVASPMSWLQGGRNLAGAVGTGMLQGALAPVEVPEGQSTGAFWLKKAVQSVLGGATGGGVHKLTHGVVKPTKAADELMDQGVSLTPGQASGPASFANRQEQRLTSLPLAGDMIDAARRRGAEDVQGRVTNRAFGITDPKAKLVAPDVRGANEAASDLYKQSVPHMWPNREGITEAADAYNRALQNPELTPQNREILTGLWDQNFANYDQLTGEGLKKLDSELGFLSRKYNKFNSSAAEETLGDAINEIKMGLRSGLGQGMPPEQEATLRAANKAYRDLIPINKAASARVDELGTPRALEKAIAQQARKMPTEMPHDPLVTNASKIMTQTIPDSGSGGRIAAMGIIPSTLGLVSSLPVAAMYSRATQALMGRTQLQKFLQPYSAKVRNAIIAALRE